MIKKLLTLLLALGMTLGAAAGCEMLTGGNNSSGDSVESSSSTEVESSSSAEKEEIEFVDYASQLTLDMDSEDTKKMEVTVKTYIDGDTTHFHTPKGFNDQNVLKARYLAVNTPESTGKIEEWGKKASKFTRTALENAESIVLETNGEDWEVDSTGERYLVWVWYIPEGETEYRNLNLQLLQEGLAVGSKISDTRYGELCTQAINQASILELHVFSDEKDPDFFYGKAIELDLKELRTNIDDYNNLRVAFEGYISYYSSQGVYVENYDEGTDMWYGMYVYYGFFLDTMAVQDILQVGYRVRIVGSVQYWEAGGTYQVCDLTYDQFDLTDPNNIQRLDDKVYDVSNRETSVDDFYSKVEVEAEVEGETVLTDYDYAELAMNTSISMKNLKVTDVYTTNNGGDNDGAMSLTCEVDGKEISVRTVVLKDAQGNVITEDQLLGETIDVTGIVDYYMSDYNGGFYQIKVFNWKNITIH